MRQTAGEQGYAGSFVAQYLLPLICPDALTRELQVLLGAGLERHGSAAFAVRYGLDAAPNFEGPRLAPAHRPAAGRGGRAARPREGRVRTQLAAFGAPVVVAVAEHDRIVPTRFGIALYDSLEGPKHLMLIKTADHNDWPDRVDAPWWQEAILRALGEKR